ncbi:hypothetical protein HanXRQr2_Chr10g0453401 [Helianthus annuus]|uniref:Uncharacterized protein n=1 Tax=Helianthus annuus TaxID=4232 RepID=A0A251TN92_HELAN|nr:hypothetical protein HanXRQr2_Chr10g0453401 [Helianthus annuus]KAJ0884749.1 hypothetical protein HanPSC8_Chr10g0437511 [Helianthus annuus]
MVTEQGFASYKRSTVHLRRAGFRGWSASHRRSPEKSFSVEILMAYPDCDDDRWMFLVKSKSC